VPRVSNPASPVGVSEHDIDQAARFLIFEAS
jgi:hypothetical protein